MLQITIPDIDLFDDEKQEFIHLKGQTLQLEHSLVSLSKWESKWHKAFLTKNEKTFEETIDYIKCMTITQNVKPEIYKYLTVSNVDAVSTYINDSMTATWFPEDKSRRRSTEAVTAELIYYWMIALQIPFECQKWHLNRLLTLIQVCNVKNAPPKKMSKRDRISQYAAINAARRHQHNSRG